MNKLTNAELQIAINQMSYYLTVVKIASGYDRQLLMWREHLSRLLEIQIERAKYEKEACS